MYREYMYIQWCKHGMHLWWLQIVYEGSSWLTFIVTLAGHCGLDYLYLTCCHATINHINIYKIRYPQFHAVPNISATGQATLCCSLFGFDNWKSFCHALAQKKSIYTLMSQYCKQTQDVFSGGQQSSKPRSMCIIRQVWLRLKLILTTLQLKAKYRMW